MVADVAVAQVAPDGEVGERESHLVPSNVVVHDHVLVHIATTEYLHTRVGGRVKGGGGSPGLRTIIDTYLSGKGALLITVVACIITQVNHSQSAGLS